MLKKLAIRALKIDVSDVLDVEMIQSIRNNEINEPGAISRVVGNGNAVIFTDGTEDEYQEQLERESKWYYKLKEWGLK